MIIFGISGQKGSGKSTLARDIARFCYDSFEVPSSDRPPAGISLCRIATFYQAPFAAPIKEIAVNLLGLDPQFIYGDDDAKNTLTNYTWDDMPHYLRLQADGKAPPANQLMTHREILQELGSGIFRQIWPQAFCNAWKNFVGRIPVESDFPVVFADDLRFPNEMTTIVEYAERRRHLYYLIRLTRGATTDRHDSETSLSNNSPGFTFVLDNEKSTREATFRQLVNRLPISDMARQIAMLRAGAYYANSI